MKNISLILFLLCIAFGLKSQSLQIIETKTSFHVKIGEEVRSSITLKNLTENPIHIMVRRDNTQLGSSQETFFCWDNDCKTQETSQTLVSQIIQPGEILETFTSVLQTGLDETASSVKYVFYNRDDPSDFVEIRLDYAVKEQISKGLLYNSADISISDIYPNPASDVAYIDYVYKNEDIETKLVLHNLLGSVVSEFKLNPVEQELKIFISDLRPGVYFYTIYVDSEGKVTKKLVVKR